MRILLTRGFHTGDGPLRKWSWRSYIHSLACIGGYSLIISLLKRHNLLLVRRAPNKHTGARTQPAFVHFISTSWILFSFCAVRIGHHHESITMSVAAWWPSKRAERRWRIARHVTIVMSWTILTHYQNMNIMPH